MKPITVDDLQTLTFPKVGSHKGQNGRLLIIGGSHLFHAASIWALEVASRIVDLVHYSSVPENNELVKKEFRDGIIVSRSDLHAYIEEDDCVLIGPGMMRDRQTEKLTHELLTTYPKKQWVIDAGALQMLDLADIPLNAILTPHHREFAGLWERSQLGNFAPGDKNFLGTAIRLQPTKILSPVAPTSVEPRIPLLDVDMAKLISKTYRCVVLLKGQKDIAVSGGVCDEKVCSPGELRVIEGGNEGMTKGGTGDVLAGLIAALACKNDPFLATIAGSFINKQAGDELYKTVGPFFNASDLAAQIPKTMKRLFVSS